MAAFRDDMPLIAGVNEDWDENTTGTQIMRPDWDFSPLRMRTMHHLTQIFFDMLRPERPDCPVLVPSSFSVSRDNVIAQDTYRYEPCGLPTGNFMPTEKAQIRLMTASPIPLCACIPAPDQVTPEQAYFKDLNFYKKTLFHTPFLSLEGAQSRFSCTETQISFSRLTIGSTNYPKQCSATYCLYSQSTPSGIRKTCATSLRTILSARYVRPNKAIFITTICSTTRVGGRSGFVQYQVAHLHCPTRRGLSDISRADHTNAESNLT